MAQQPFTRKESPEKDVRHAQRQVPPGELPPLPSGEPRPGQVRSENVFPAGMTPPDPEIYAEGTPVIFLQPYVGTTARYTISDLITQQQAEDAGQATPKRLEDLPEEAVKKAKLMGVVHVSDEERAALQKEAADDQKQRWATQGRVPPAAGGVVHPTASGQHEQPLHGAGKTAGEAATQSKYDNRGGGEEGKR